MFLSLSVYLFHKQKYHHATRIILHFLKYILQLKILLLTQKQIFSNFNTQNKLTFYQSNTYRQFWQDFNIMNEQAIVDQHKPFNLRYSEYQSFSRDLSNYQFDKYLILEKIGKGSFASVYRGIVKETGQEVAIKVINLKEVNSTQNQKLKEIKLKLIFSESRIMMKFDSPNVLKCYECFQSQDFKFMVQEYCNGGDLYQKIAKQQKIREQQAINILRQIVNAIGQLHSKKIIHRDLKAQNIMIHNGIYKLADFGFSKLLQIRDQNEKCYNTCLGTPTTMAPEVRNRQFYGLKADIWSIGVIFYQMIFGQSPFDTKANPNKVAQKIAERMEKEEFYHGVNPSDKVKKFLKEVLVVDPQKRLGWRQLMNHQIFREDSKGLGDSFERKVTFELKEDDLLKIEKDLVQSQRENLKQDEKAQEKQEKDKENNEENKRKNGISVQSILNSLISADSALKSQIPSSIVSYLDNQPPLVLKHCQSHPLSQTQYMRVNGQKWVLPQPNLQEQRLYQWSLRAFIQCLKTELIYNKIILAIQQRQLLNMKRRSSIELMYLLCTRCFNNLAPIYIEYEKNKESSVLRELKEKIERLYKDVGEKWKLYSDRLTEKENEKLEMAADWTRRVILSKLFPQTYDYHKKERFMTGLQSNSQVIANFRLSSQLYQDPTNSEHSQSQPEPPSSSPSKLKDYSRQQQISFTVQYYLHTKQKFLKKQTLQCKEVLRYLDNFQKICNVKRQQMKGQVFRKYVERMVWG